MEESRICLIGKGLRQIGDTVKREKFKKDEARWRRALQERKILFGVFKKKLGSGCSSFVEYMPNMWKSLSSTPRTVKII